METPLWMFGSGVAQEIVQGQRMPLQNLDCARFFIGWGGPAAHWTAEDLKRPERSKAQERLIVLGAVRMWFKECFNKIPSTLADLAADSFVFDRLTEC